MLIFMVFIKFAEPTFEPKKNRPVAMEKPLPISQCSLSKWCVFLDILPDSLGKNL